jgi:hypothetical protein
VLICWFTPVDILIETVPPSEGCRDVVIPIVATALIVLAFAAIAAGVVTTVIICCFIKRYNKSKYVISKKDYIERNNYSAENKESLEMKEN